MDRAQQNIPKSLDGDDVFGQYVASELKSMENPHMKRFTKWKIQSLIFHAHSEYAMPPWQHPDQSQDQTQSMCYRGSNQFMSPPPYSSNSSTMSCSNPSPSFPLD